jgi:two-component system copper resistance phosphate regulon response regulator CusR
MADSGDQPKAILLVDDEPRLREALARSLTVRGHSVDQAATHKEAVNAATKGEYDLLLIDINLPDATGWDVLRDLRDAGREIPAIVLSAVPPSTTCVREFRPLGVLHKPFPIEALLRLVRPIAEQPRQSGLSAGDDVAKHDAA